MTESSLPLLGYLIPPGHNKWEIPALFTIFAALGHFYDIITTRALLYLEIFREVSLLGIFS